LASRARPAPASDDDDDDDGDGDGDEAASWGAFCPPLRRASNGRKSCHKRPHCLIMFFL